MAQMPTHTWPASSELRQAAAAENRSKMSKRRPGWMRTNALVVELLTRLRKALRMVRKEAKKLTTAHAYSCAMSIRKDMGANARWVSVWLDATGWKLRRPAKKRKSTAAPRR